MSRSSHNQSAQRAGSAVIQPEHLYKFAGLIFLLALLYRYFEEISRVLLVVYAAALFAVALNVVVRRIPLQRKWVVGMVGIVGFIAGAALLWFGGSAVLRQLRDLVESLPAIELSMREWGSAIHSRVGIDVTLIGEHIGEATRDFFANLSGSDVIGQAGGLISALLFPLLIFFGGLFALARPNDHLLTPLLQAVPEERRNAARRFFELMGARITGWVKGQIIAMLSIGVLATVAFYIIGVPYALLLGVVNGLTEFVPILGPWVGGIPAVILAFLDEPSKGLWTAVAILGIQQLEAQIITPLVMSKAADVHPFVTLFAIVLFGSLFGFLGILLALPLVLLFWTAAQVFWVERAIHSGDDVIAPVVEE